MINIPNMIDRFTGEYRFLSNFYPSPLFIDGMRFPTVEHAFQASKTSNTADRQRIALARSPGRAKSIGRKVRLRKDWEAVKVGVMKRCVELKFLNDEELADRLLQTGNARLIEGNTWNDTFWGVSGGRGKNHLGRILMQVRAQILNSSVGQA